MSKGTLRISGRRKSKFLKTLASTGLVKRAAESANASTAYFYSQRQRDPDFAKAWDNAVTESVDILEEKAWTRATEGAEKPVFYKGKKVDTYKEPSDRLLEFLMRGKRPEVYGDRTKLESRGLDSIANLLESISKSGGSTQARLARTFAGELDTHEIGHTHEIGQVVGQAIELDSANRS